MTAALIAAALMTLVAPGRLCSRDADPMIIDYDADSFGSGRRKKPPVAFDHEEHSVDHRIPCAGCHHEKERRPGRCLADDCHGPRRRVVKGKLMPELEDAFHETCKGCHRENRSGPIKCNDCHDRRLVSSAGEGEGQPGVPEEGCAWLTGRWTADFTLASPRPGALGPWNDRTVSTFTGTIDIGPSFVRIRGITFEGKLSCRDGSFTFVGESSGTIEGCSGWPDIDIYGRRLSEDRFLATVSTDACGPSAGLSEEAAYGIKALRR